MLVYVDSSVLARAYLPDEIGHQNAVELIYGAAHLLVTATWSLVEVTSALTRAVRASRGNDDLDTLLAAVDADLGNDGPVTLLRADQQAVEHRAREIIRQHALRSLDALHLAVAEIAAQPLTEPREPLGVATRDDAQRAAAHALGFVTP